MKSIKGTQAAIYPNDINDLHKIAIKNIMTRVTTYHPI